MATLSVLGCGEKPTPVPAEVLSAPDDVSETLPSTGYVEMGDLPELRTHGQLRVAAQRRPEVGYLPRTASARPRLKELAEELAVDLDLDFRIVWVDSEAEALAAVLDGRADITLGRRLSASAQAPAGAAFTLPASVAEGHILTRADDELVDPADLAGRRVAVHASSPFLPDVLQLLETVSFGVDTVPEAVHPEEMIHRVALGQYDVSVVESDVVAAASAYRDDMRVAFSLPTQVRHVALVRSAATELRQAVDQFLLRVLVEGGSVQRYDEDLDGLRERGIFRVITVNGPSTYFLWRGHLVGFDYELVKRFAAEQKLRVRMVVAPTVDRALPWLAQGRGDLVAVGLGPEAVSRVAGLTRTSVVHDVQPVVVARPNEAPASEVSELQGRSVVMRASSPYLTVVEALRDSLSFSLEVVNAPISTSRLVDAVANGEYDLTVLPSHLADAELAGRDDAVAALRLGEAGGLAWVVRDTQPQLRAAIDDFLGREFQGVFYNVLVRKYFRQDTRVVIEEAYDPAADGLSPFDDIVQKYSTLYEFDWRAITAQMYVESRFDPEAVSDFGAIGLMQVMPATAADIGLTRLTDPDEGVHAGVKYMDWARARFAHDELEPTDWLAFTLASYNAGFGHVSDARQVADLMGLDRNRWFENVEVAMLRLSDPEVYQALPHGYARGSEPVNYVRRITELGSVYLRVTEAQRR